MKRSKVLAALLLFLLPLIAWVGLAQAQTMRSGEHATVARGEIINSTLFAFANTIDVAGEVRGDVICAGQNISISGRVDGDVICAGQTIHISGDVTGDVRLAGQTVSVGSDVDGSAMVASQSFTLEGDAQVGRDASIASETVTLNGPIDRDLAAAGTRVVLNSRVGRNVNARVNNLTLNEKAVVGGSLEYTSSNEVTLARGAEVEGTTTRHQPPQENKSNYGTVFGFSFSFAAYMIISLLLLALALVLLFPGVFHDASTLALRDPLKTFLIGLAATILAPALIIGLLITVIGIPLGLLLALIWWLVLALSGPMFAYFLGRLILRGNKHSVLIMLVGSLVVLLSYLVPVLGVVVLLAALWMGTGMFLREAMRRTPPPKYSLQPAAAEAPARTTVRNKRR